MIMSGHVYQLFWLHGYRIILSAELNNLLNSSSGCVGKLKMKNKHSEHNYTISNF